LPAPSKQAPLDANDARQAGIGLDTKRKSKFYTDAAHPTHGICDMPRCIFADATSTLLCCICLAMTDIAVVGSVLC